MTTRINSFHVVLAQDVREDDVAPILTALKMIKGVLDVIPHAASYESEMAEARARRGLEDKVYKALRRALEEKKS